MDEFLDISAAEFLDLQVPAHRVAICWLGQAGFAIKNSSDQIIFIDVYLSDMCEKGPGQGVIAKRMVPAPIRAEDILRGTWLCTHAHEDHFDEETLATVSHLAPTIEFAGTASCIRRLGELGLFEARRHPLEVGEAREFDGFSVDHMA